uniref:RING-type domain-containing protein n=1 Tax=Rhabditophanes sp. KR3021 TaxID=114890 RepID=A0AC35U094_9BILA
MDFAVGSLGNGFLEEHKEKIISFLEVALRLPGPLLLELWWRKRNSNFTQMTEDVFTDESLQYLDSTRILEFVHSRNLDESAAMMLSYTVLFISALILLMPLKKLSQIYTNFVLICFSGFAHYMSISYVEGEQRSSDEYLILNNFVKLERHGSFIAAQVILAVFQTCILRLTSEFAAPVLPVYVLPIFARMSGMPKNSLNIFHNISCVLNVVLIITYVLIRVPYLIKEIQNGLKRVKTILFLRGIPYGILLIYKQVRLSEILIFSWLTMLGTKMTYEYYGKERSIEDLGSALIATIADCTSTPISLLSLAITVSQLCRFIVIFVQYVIFNNERGAERDGNQGYTEALTLLLLCAQAGLLGLKSEQKTFMLKLIFFIVLSALMQNLYNLLEPQMLSLSSSTNASRSRHTKCLIFAVSLILGPIYVSYLQIQILSVDLWCVIIVANCALTCLRTCSCTIIYFLTIVENKSLEPWEIVEDLTFYIRTITSMIELILATFVVIHGIFASFLGYWSAISLAIMIFHSYFNIWKRTQICIASIKARYTAVSQIKQLPKVAVKTLEDLEDLCCICMQEMKKEARMTPCKHIFHGYCLKKWISIKAVCPLCYKSLVSKEEAEEMQRLMQVQNINNRRHVNMIDDTTSNGTRSRTNSTDSFATSSDESSDAGIDLDSINLDRNAEIDPILPGNDWDSE